MGVQTTDGRIADGISITGRFNLPTNTSHHAFEWERGLVLGGTLVTLNLAPYDLLDQLLDVFGRMARIANHTSKSWVRLFGETSTQISVG